MAKVIIPQYVAIINGVRCDVAPGVRDHYLTAAGGDASKLPITFEENGFLEIDSDDSLAIAKATLGDDPDDRR